MFSGAGASLLLALLAQSLILAADAGFGADRRSLRKMNLMPRPPLLGEVAKPSGFDGEV